MIIVGFLPAGSWLTRFVLFIIKKGFNSTYIVVRPLGKLLLTIGRIRIRRIFSREMIKVEKMAFQIPSISCYLIEYENYEKYNLDLVNSLPAILYF